MRKIYLAIVLLLNLYASAQVAKAPLKKEGVGPYTQLILRGVTMINGTGAPPTGPMDIVVEGNRIVQIAGVGSGMPINDSRRSKLKEGGREMDLTGHYIMPGFIDMHGHIGGTGQGAYAEYVFKLWMAH
ncbi:MAG TPA: hypothetical protein VFV46_11865, partial [Lacibacter sp.]|nr:hypothetical protein [Lacibacter sp.]